MPRPDEHTGAPPAQPEGTADEIQAPDISFARTLFQFFLIPALVVSICVSVFFFFAWMVSNEKTGEEYLQEIRLGGASRRWQAAFELSKLITLEGDEARMTALVPQMVDAFEAAESDDPRIRHYLALSLGHLKSEQAVPTLVEALNDADSSTRIYAAWALGNIGDTRAVQPMIRLIRDQDAGVRKMAVYGLGAIGDPRAAEELIPALQDSQLDVSWNAAIALAQLGSRAGLVKILQMLDRTYLNSVTDMNDAQRLLAMESAIQGAALLGGKEIEQRLRGLADGDPNLGIRRAAMKALADLEAQETVPKTSGELP